MRTYRLYTEMGLQVRTKRRKKLVRPRVPLAVLDRPGEHWSIDFIHDQLACGRRFRGLNVIDDFSRECIGQIVDTSISGERSARFLDQLSEQCSGPASLSATTAPNSRARRCSFGRSHEASSCILFSPASRYRTHSSKASMPSSGTVV